MLGPTTFENGQPRRESESVKTTGLLREVRALNMLLEKQKEPMLVLEEENKRLVFSIDLYQKEIDRLNNKNQELDDEKTAIIKGETEGNVFDSNAGPTKQSIHEENQKLMDSVHELQMIIKKLKSDHSNEQMEAQDTIKHQNQAIEHL